MGAEPLAFLSGFQTKTLSRAGDAPASRPGTARLAAARLAAAECLGTALLVATVVGSGIMAQTLSAPSPGVALLGNTIATAGMLYVLVTVFGPVSGAHLNPAVTLARALSDTFSGIALADAPAFVASQLAGAPAALGVCHRVFGWRPPVLDAPAADASGLLREPLQP